MTAQTKECLLCHRIGTRGFVPTGDRAWVCRRDDLCRQRLELRYDDATAVLSECGRYRYRLERRWGRGSAALFVMLNPSTADANVDDRTIRRCIGYAHRWGYPALSVVNLYAYRATDPRELWKAPDPIGPENNRHLIEAAAEAGVVVAAWGVHAQSQRVDEVLTLPGLSRATALALSRDGHPRHPLYLRGDLTPGLHAVRRPRDCPDTKPTTVGRSAPRR